MSFRPGTHHIQMAYVPIMPAIEQKAYELITKIGVVEDKQLRRLLRISEKDNESFMYCLRNLLDVKGKLITDEHLVVRTDNPHVKLVASGDELISKLEGGSIKSMQKTTECLWDVISRLDQVDIDLLEIAERPATIMYTLELFGTVDRLTVIDVFVDRDNLHILNELQERYYDRCLWDENDLPICNVVLNYVTTDMDLLNIILDRSEPNENGEILNPIFIPTTLTFIDHEMLNEDGTPVVKRWTSDGEVLRLLYAADLGKVRNQNYANIEA